MAMKNLYAKDGQVIFGSGPITVPEAEMMAAAFAAVAKEARAQTAARVQAEADKYRAEMEALRARIGELEAKGQGDAR